jgi:hypothetical protein
MQDLDYGLSFFSINGLWRFGSNRNALQGLFVVCGLNSDACKMWP